MPEKSPLWECKPRTKAKLEILTSYLGAWFGILARSGFPHVFYVDGFCGPGAYEGGEDGSPVIAARLASATAQLHQRFRATLILVDEDPAAIAHLKGLANIKTHHPNVTIEIKESTFSDEIDNIAAELARHRSSPTFSFIDPFGFGHSPFARFKLLMPNDSSELFINFWCGYMNRFKEHSDPAVTAKIKSMVGTDDLDSIIEADDPIDAFCIAFEQNLRTLGQHTLKFMMRDEGNIRDNAFFFCGNNPRGFEKIKQAMWKVDPVNGSAFSAHREITRDAAQGDLFGDGASTSSLYGMIFEQFRGRRGVTVAEIFKWVVDKTETFLKPHARVELERLLAAGKILSVTDPNRGARKRRAKDWPERLILDFTDKT